MGSLASGISGLRLPPLTVGRESHMPTSFKHPELPAFAWLFIPSPFPSGLGQLIDAFSILLGGRWEDRQAARKSWWLLN